MSNMGARITRVITNFNLENRVHREISKLKPRAAPRYPTSDSPPQHNTAGDTQCYRMLNSMAVLMSRFLSYTMLTSKFNFVYVSAGSMTEDINLRNDPLLSMLKDVYVESKDPVSQVRRVSIQRSP